VRELENILERALALCEGERITADDLVLPDPGGAGQTPAPLAPAREPPLETAGLDERLAEMERKTILEALEETRWNRTAAAKKLGMSFRQLRYRLEKLGL
jgi:two-component system response regulator PilR (NtrC family)